jgi:hypothetical protein
VLKNENGVAVLPAVSAWKIDDKQMKFVELKTEGLRCSRDGLLLPTAGFEPSFLPADDLEIERRQLLGNDRSELDRLDLHGAFAGEVCPHPPCAFALL